MSRLIYIFTDVFVVMIFCIFVFSFKIEGERFLSKGNQQWRRKCSNFVFMLHVLIGVDLCFSLCHRHAHVSLSAYRVKADVVRRTFTLHQ